MTNLDSTMEVFINTFSLKFKSFKMIIFEKLLMFIYIFIYIYLLFIYCLDFIIFRFIFFFLYHNFASSFPNIDIKTHLITHFHFLY